MPFCWPTLPLKTTFCLPITISSSLTHHLEAATTDAMAYRLRAQDVNHLVRDLGNPGTGSDGAASFRRPCFIETFRPGELTKLVAEATDRAFALTRK